MERGEPDDRDADDPRQRNVRRRGHGDRQYRHRLHGHELRAAADQPRDEHGDHGAAGAHVCVHLAEHHDPRSRHHQRQLRVHGHLRERDLPDARRCCERSAVAVQLTHSDVDVRRCHPTRDVPSGRRGHPEPAAHDCNDCVPSFAGVRHPAARNDHPDLRQRLDRLGRRPAEQHVHHQRGPRPRTYLRRGVRDLRRDDRRRQRRADVRVVADQRLVAERHGVRPRPLLLARAAVLRHP
mmetsp:Transcript_10683/g.33147  ORF Transcript_10683/g.33147 Transcript_10683/m.33147 type:complete len:238 (-) Transcript_10683:812-1525(-)